MIELLAPAGDTESLRFAVLYGADAVYLGINNFSMRSRNVNFADLADAVNFAHARNVRVYLTCNTTPTNAETDAFPLFIEEAAETGIDAAITADIGVFFAVKKYAPSLEIHISTQTGVTNYAAAAALAEMGAKRVVLARELSLADIAVIREKLPREVELEAFVHGSMCVSFSGRCLLSQYMAGRDANRGACAQPCRWKYYLVEEENRLNESRPRFYEIGENPESGGFDRAYILNARDMCMIEHLRELSAAGVNSFKIEGRAKSAYYTATVVNAYRAAIDSDSGVPEWALREVFAVSHREYGTGFYLDSQPSQVYETSGYSQTRGFAGVVTHTDKNILYVTQRNYFTLSDTLEILQPQCQPQLLRVKEMRNANGDITDTANHAEEKLTIVCHNENVKSDSIIRKVL